MKCWSQVMESTQRDGQSQLAISITFRTFLPKTFPLINWNHVLTQHFPELQFVQHQTILKTETDVLQQKWSKKFKKDCIKGSYSSHSLESNPSHTHKYVEAPRMRHSLTRWGAWDSTFFSSLSIKLMESCITSITWCEHNPHNTAMHSLMLFYSQGVSVHSPG